MHLTIDLFTAFSCIISLVSVRASYLYEKQNFYGLGRRFLSKPFYVDLGAGEHPDPLPTVRASAPGLMPSPFRSLYQGIRGQNDTRVFRRRFEYPARLNGHQVSCEAMLDCIISFLAVESTEAIPIILRGGAGYRHFSAIIKAKPGRELKGQIRAYCRHAPPERPAVRALKSFKFSQKVLTENDN